MSFDRVSAKLEARAAMKSASVKPMLVTAAFTLIAGAVSSAIMSLGGMLMGLNGLTNAMAGAMFSGYSQEDAMLQAMARVGMGRVLVGGLLIVVLSAVWTALMQYGYIAYCLDLSRRADPPLQRIFAGFPAARNVIVSSLLTGVFVTLWTMLFYAGFIALVMVGAFMSDALFYLLMMVATVGLVAGVLWVTLRFAMVPYLVMDQGLSGLDALRESKRMTQGHKGELFVLELSFIGWYLVELAIMLGAFVVAGVVIAVTGASVNGPIGAAGLVGAGSIVVILGGFGVWVFGLWLTPYVQTVLARYYDWLRQSEGSVAGPGGGYRQVPPEYGGDRPIPPDGGFYRPSDEPDNGEFSGSSTGSGDPWNWPENGKPPQDDGGETWIG